MSPIPGLDLVTAGLRDLAKPSLERFSPQELVVAIVIGTWLSFLAGLRGADA
jgi:hypothetical protein